MTAKMQPHDNNTEIERKFLVSDLSFIERAYDSVHMAQGYICSRRCTARIRVTDREAFLTIKGKSYDGGLSRFEWERNIPVSCAGRLLSRCSGVIEKVRYYVMEDGYRWEVDVFEGDNQGLIVAEVELQHRSENPTLPSWILKEVTGCRYYHNSYLSKFPYKLWK